MDIKKPFPKNWESKEEYVAIRLLRLARALPFCRGRAADVRPIVEKEIERLSIIYDKIRGFTKTKHKHHTSK